MTFQKTTCLLPEEIQSLHWTQEIATVYPIVVIRKNEDEIHEDHIVFISNYKKHDVLFVELILQKHFSQVL